MQYICIAMVMDTLQVRLTSGLIEKIDSLIDSGIYSNRSDVIRDAIRRLVLDKLTGIIENKEDSVKELRKIRTQLSKQKFNLDEINKLAD